MKNVEIKKRGDFLTLPPVGAYVAEIQNVRIVKAGENQKYDVLEMMLDIVEGEFAGRFKKVYDDQNERFDNAKYKGIFRLNIPSETSEDWVDRKFGNNIWCVQESNAGYEWDGDEKKLKGKKVGISIRRRLYTYNNQDRETTEIGQFETIQDVKGGKCKPMRDRDTRNNSSAASTDGSGFTDVSKSEPDVPW